MKYRADIDGLRAVAIILVLIYHGGLSWFPAGFVGVDVFFVISGFLITTIIHHSLTNEHFSFIEFYNRRLWRLQPAFVCCLLVTVLLTVLFFLPDDLIQYGKSARKTSLFLSNVYFKKTTTGYFSPDVYQLPLLHMWSLSIEWQCYLILPFMMYGLHRLFHKYLLVVISLLTLTCFVLCLHYSHVQPAQTYYLFSSRIFEFLIGSCIALLPVKENVIDRRILNVAGVVALGVIIYIASLDHLFLVGYPNWYALSVCLATAFLLALGTFYPTLACIKVYSIKPIVFIGLLSYSLYLWHWPMFAFLRYYSIAETPLILFIVYGIIFIVAYLSWKYIEKPARRFKTISFRYSLLALVFIPIVMIHLIAHLLTVYDGVPARFNNELVSIYQKLEQYASTQRPKCMSGEQGVIDLQCRLGVKSKNSKTGLMIGDSFANHYWGFMDALGKNAGVSIVTQGISTCMVLPGIYLYDWWYYKNQVYQPCYEQTQKYYQMIQDNHYDYVILGQIWSNYISDNIINNLDEPRSIDLTKKRLEVALDRALAIITTSGATPVIINTSALMEKNFHDCFFKHIKLRQPYVPGQCNFKLIISYSDQWFDQLFAKMKVKYPQLVVIDPKLAQCKNGQCVADIEGVPVYRDIGHITDYASYKLGQLYLKEFHNPLQAA